MQPPFWLNAAPPYKNLASNILLLIINNNIMLYINKILFNIIYVCILSWIIIV
jgi:hypothetical protein